MNATIQQNIVCFLNYTNMKDQLYGNVFTSVSSSEVPGLLVWVFTHGFISSFSSYDPEA